jgi:cellulose synthase/poly-beta-1,6-N-acetylglucosamine synthase-like glycosyltransferase
MSLAFGPARRPRSSPRRWSHGAKGDASLPKGRALPHDLAFLAALDLPQGLLWKIAAKARKQGVAAHEALLAEEIVSPEVYYACLARRLNLAFSIDQAPDDAIAPQGQALLDLLDRFASTGRTPVPGAVITTPRRLARRARSAAGATIAERATHGLGRADTSLTAERVPSRCVAACLALLLGGSGAALIAGGLPWLLFSCLVSIILCGAIVTRLLATLHGRLRARAKPPDLPEHKLPRYTILVPLYKEAAVVAALLDALERIDYPRAKLDIKLLVEADDHETRLAIERLAPGPAYDIVIAPPGHPRTKPRALNIGLALARGELVAVYDAEDDPDPRQLRRAAAAFAQAPQSLACLQCPLAIDNARDSWLAGLFALDYASLFDVLNPGLARLGLPIPLGGTSNHFRIAALRRLHGWDAWNVTEDADMGVRLARMGYEVATLDAPTYEEAPARPGAWLAQRRRWMKGWMQTLIVHLRHPLRLVRELGLMRAMALTTMLAGGVLGPLVGPLYVALFVHDGFRGALFSPVTPWDALTSALWCAIAATGAVALLVPIFIGARRRGLTRLLSLLPLLPIYQALLGLAAAMALADLFRRPHHWAKTTHGLARSSLRTGRIG